MLAGTTALAFAIPIVAGWLCGWLFMEALLKRSVLRLVAGIFILLAALVMGGYL